MGYLWDFGIDEEEWDLTTDCNLSEWTFDEGHNGFGCIHMASRGSECGSMGMDKTLTPAESGYTDLSLWIKYTSLLSGEGEERDLTWRVTYDDETTWSDTYTLETETESDWIELSTTSLDAGKSVETISIECNNVNAGFDFLEIWVDDVQLGDIVVATPEFYHWTDGGTPEKKADLSFNVNPKGMAINPDTSDVVVVSNTAQATMSERMLKDENYATANDFSDGLATDEDIDAVEYI